MPAAKKKPAAKKRSDEAAVFVLGDGGAVTQARDNEALQKRIARGEVMVVTDPIEETVVLRNATDGKPRTSTRYRATPAQFKAFAERTGVDLSGDDGDEAA